MGSFKKSSVSSRERFQGKHRFEHWYRNNTVYFVTARTEEGAHVFRSPEAQEIFWEALERWRSEYGLALWIATLMSNHYHLIFYLRFKENLGPFMQRFHGSVAKQVNDLRAERLKPFWCWKGRQTYYDGCLRDETQVRRTYRYVQTQSVRARLVRDWKHYPHTKIWISLDKGLEAAQKRKVFLTNVPYARYLKPRPSDPNKPG